MKLLSTAKFAAGRICYYINDDPMQPVRDGDVIQPATVEINGITLHSDTPTSAAMAERINKGLEAHVLTFEPHATL